MKTVESLKNLYVKFGGAELDTIGKNTIPEVLDLIAKVAPGMPEVEVSAVPGSEVIFETAISTLQSNVKVGKMSIEGILNYVSSGGVYDAFGYGGNFLALQFTPDLGATSTKVGLYPTYKNGAFVYDESGLVELDEDLNGIFKITDKEKQVFVVKTTDGTFERRQKFDLSGLILKEE